MGQYWKGVNLDKKESVKPDWIKLMEHSYIKNPAMNYVMWLLKWHWKWDRIKWIWDYADGVEDPDFPLYSNANIIKNFDWDERYNPENINCYIINLDKKEYISLKNYILNMIKKYDNQWRIIHPLSLLTAVGNNQWWWDFHDSKTHTWFNLVWIWNWDHITVEDEFNNPEYKEILPEFSEDKPRLQELSNEEAIKIFEPNYQDSWCIINENDLDTNKNKN